MKLKYRFNKLIAAAIAFAGMTLLLAGCSPEHQLDKAQSLEKRGKYYAAWQRYQEFAAKYPKHEGAAEATFRAGWLSQRQLNDCSMANVFYDSVLEKYPTSAPWARLATNQKANCPDYFPLIPGAEWVEGDSDSGGKNARIEIVCKALPDGDAMPSEAGQLSKTYFAGKEKFKTTQLTYRKVEGEVRETSVENELRSKVILHLPVLVGTKWKTRSGERLFSYEIVANDKTVKVEAGEFTNCILVRSSADGVPGATNEYYAPTVGKVLTTFSTEAGEKRNTELLTFKPAGEVDFKSLSTNP